MLLRRQIEPIQSTVEPTAIISDMASDRGQRELPVGFVLRIQRNNAFCPLLPGEARDPSHQFVSCGNLSTATRADQ